MCAKLGKELDGMPFKPFDNELGQRIYDQISDDAWKAWLEHSKIIINEYQLELNTQKAHEILWEQCEKFLFGEGAALPSEYVPPKE